MKTSYLLDFAFGVLVKGFAKIKQISNKFLVFRLFVCDYHCETVANTHIVDLMAQKVLNTNRIIVVFAVFVAKTKVLTNFSNNKLLFAPGIKNSFGINGCVLEAVRANFDENSV